MFWLSFALGVAFISPLPDASSAPKWALLSVAIPILVLVSEKAKFSVGAFFLGLFTLHNGVSLLWTPVLFDGLDLFWHLLLFAGLFSIAPHVHMPDVYRGLGCALLFNSAAMLFQVTGWDILSQVNPIAGTPGGTFMNRNASAEIAVLVMIGLVLSAPTWRDWLLIGLISFPLFPTTMPRGAWLALLAAGALWGARRSRVVLLCAPAALLCTFAMMVIWPTRFWTVTPRLELWFDAARNLNPWGHGLGSFRVAYPYFEYAHNDLLQIAYETGGIGVGLIVGAIGLALWGPGREREKLVLVAFLVLGVFAFPMWLPATGFLAALVLGHLCHDRSAVRDLKLVGERGSDEWQTYIGRERSRAFV